MIAYIPARGGSKRLKNKSIKNFCGKSLIIWTIEYALKSRYIDKVIVDTDCLHIKKIAEDNGAYCPYLRPNYLAEDNVNIIRNIKYMWQWMIWWENLIIKDFVLLQATSPLRNNKDIDEAIFMFYQKKADSIISYCKESHPVNWHKYIDNDFKFIDINENDSYKQSQDYRTSYYPNGAIYVLNYNKTIKKGTYYTNKSYAYLMPFHKSIDIDTIEDFELAEYYFLKNESKNESI